MILLLLLSLLQDPTDAVLGWWNGTPICVRGAFNPACHDEAVRYRFVRDPGRGDTITLHAFKIVHDSLDWMGDLSAVYVAGRGRWVAEFSNPRTHIEIGFWLSGNELRGEMVDLPLRRKRRDMAAHR